MPFIVMTAGVVTSCCADPPGNSEAPTYPENAMIFPPVPNVNWNARLAWLSLADHGASNPASETSQMWSMVNVVASGRPGICALALPWMVVASMNSKFPPDEVIFVAVVMLAPKVIFPPCRTRMFRTA